MKQRFPRRSEAWPAVLTLDPPRGSHFATLRLGYAHHGVYVGNGKVVHYAGLSRSWRSGPVVEVALSRFAFGHPVRMVAHPESTFSAQEIVRRARSRVGEHDYRPLTNNCEHFCNWCVSGLHRSEQVERSLGFPAFAFSFAGNLAGRLPRIRTRQRSLVPRAVCTGVMPRNLSTLLFGATDAVST